ncbi:hypothetical protein PTNB73_00162 [Pyrenophora teres f. teres]|uniref:MFS-1 multi-domain protein n=1 Tax=Pyrenophora teres f. teres TaxID=97479 RepID=A0A6S6VRM5_9PLEO|nr:hypothetical protein HRS9139_01404 [Pyrenophora teres f. teres]KAE8851145.1 hypothetical protein HRS9122_01432 [Pyrenophora teres f. teres]KAE8869818.1 hypothetical protein PTNB29_00162 [Pyrenophora teres f. teres]KAE8873530.1 hypothetical protein PTNB73_00162 [Pyrenophora teres f. teres]CAE7008192.1 MFS-1 multi-domain protein [Pyrenophora teres f. teres]
MITSFEAYGIYLSHYLAENIYPDATPWDYAFIGGVNFPAAMFLAPLVIVFCRKCGIHVNMCCGVLLQSTGIITASFATRIWQLHISQGALIGYGVGFLYIPCLPVLSQWFEKKRSLANGISAAESGAIGAAFAWGTEAIIQRFTIGWALRITGIIAFAASAIATVFIRDRNKAVQPSQLWFDTELLRRHEVILLRSWVFVSMMGYIFPLLSLSDFALSIGLSKFQATDMIGFLNISNAIGRPIIGILSNRWSRIDTRRL